MKILVSRLALLLVAVLCISSLVLAQGTTITLLHVNDTHSHLDGFGPKDASLNGTLGGIARAATVIGTIKATESNVLLLHAGDLSVGDPLYNVYFGVPEYQLMLQMGFDAMTIGNHEFDFGPNPLNDVLSTAFAGGSFPILGANLDMDAVPGLKNFIQPAVVKTFGSVKVGIFGMTIPHEVTSNPSPVIVRDDLVQIAQQMIDSLRTKENVQVVVFLSHLGIYLDKLIAANTVGIDFLVGGHDHYLFTEPVMVSNPLGKQVPIFQAGEFYKYVGKLQFTVDNGAVTMGSYTILNVDSTVTPEPTVQGVIDYLKQGIVAKFGDIYSTQLGTATHDIAKKYDPASPLRDTPMGNLVTDAFRAKTGTELAITALGLISEKLYAGPIVGADVFRAMSYGFDVETGYGLHLAIVKIKGSELLKGLEVGLSQLGVTDDYFLQVSGMTYKYEPKREIGHRIVKGSIKVNGRPFIDHQVYTVTMNAGLVMLLSQLGLVAEDIQMLPDFEFGVIKDYIQQLGMVNATAEGRIWDNSIHPVKKGDYLPAMGAESYNYPNPFNPATTISFSLPAKTFVSLRIYNSLGQEVATLLNGETTAGAHQVVWNAANAASGMYFYRLTTNTFSETHKMLLMK